MTSISLSKQQLKVAAALLTALLIVWFNVNRISGKSRMQEEFEMWLGTFDRPHLSGENIAGVEVSVKGDATANPPINWQLATGNEVQNERVLRILQLAREGNLFTRGRKPEPPDSAPGRSELDLTVAQGTYRFSTRIPRTELETSPQAMLFLKLFDQFQASMKQEQAAAASIATGTIQ